MCKTFLVKSNILVFISLLLCSCSLGPHTLYRTHLAYNKSAQLTQNEQMLLNLVRVRYLEQPFFLQIASISATYTYGASATASTTIPKEELDSIGIIASYTGSLTGSYQEYPTFTLSPLHGSEYYKFLLENMDVSQLALLDHWRFDFIMDFLVERIGKTYNSPHEANASYKDFVELKQILNRMQQRENLDIDYQVRVDGKSTQVYYYMELMYKDVEEAERVEALLGVSREKNSKERDPLTGIYILSSTGQLDIAPEDKKGRPIVPIKLVSFLEVLNLMGQYVDVPDDHLESGLVLKSITTTAKHGHKQLIQIRQSASKPQNAFLGVKYRDHWFFIDDSDVYSKIAFAYLNLLYTMQSRNVTSLQPTLTIPVR